MKNVINGLAYNDEVRFYILDGQELVQEISKNHNMSSVVTAASGRMAMVTAIMGLTLKNEEKITTIIDGDGPIKQMITTANARGEVKTTVSNAQVENTYYKPGKLNVASAIGNGSLRVIKDLGLEHPYVSSINLSSSEIIEDFTQYFAKSEQIPTAITGGVLIGEDMSIQSAGVLFVQLLPNASEQTIVQLEGDFLNLLPITEILKAEDPIYLLDNFFPDYRILSEHNVEFVCNCSYEKFLTSLKLLSSEEIEDLQKNETVEVVCHFCMKKYQIKTEEI